MTTTTDAIEVKVPDIGDFDDVPAGMPTRRTRGTIT